MPSRYVVDHPTFPVNRRYFQLVVIHEDCQAATIFRQIFGLRRVYRETFFANPRASSSSPYPGGFSPWISNVSEHTSPHVKDKRQIPDTVLNPRFRRDRQPEIQSSLVREDFQRIMRQTNSDCRSQTFILTNSLTHKQLLVGR